MKRFDYSKRLQIGNQVAESDWPTLKDSFIEIEAVSFVGASSPAIILGRKGSGKTALRLHFQRSSGINKRAVEIEPSYQDLVLSFEYLINVEKRTYSTEFIAQLWEITSYLNLVRIAYRHFEDKDVPPELSDLPRALVDDIIKGERYGIGRTIALFGTSFGSVEARATLMRALKTYLKNRLRDSPTQFYVLIDSVDDVIHNTLDATSRNDLFSTFFEGLWAFCKSFQNLERNELANKVFFHVFIPLDLYRWSVGRHADHLRQYKHLVSWTTDDLEEFLLLRLLHNLPGSEQKRIGRLSKVERNAAIWKAFFPPLIQYRAYVSSGPMEFPLPFRDSAIRMTLRRPRDLQEIVNQIYLSTSRAKAMFPTEDLIQSSFQKYSLEMRESVVKEYGMILPEIGSILTAFAGNDTVMSANTITDLVGQIVGQEKGAIERAMRILFEACVIGAVRNGQIGEGSVIFYYDVDDFALFWGKVTNYAIHRAFWHALQLQPLRSGLAV